MTQPQPDINTDDCQLRALQTTQEFLSKVRSKCTDTKPIQFAEILLGDVRFSRQIADIFFHYFTQDTQASLELRQEALNMSIHQNTGSPFRKVITRKEGFNSSKEFLDHAMPLFEAFVEKVAADALLLCQSTPQPRWQNSLNGVDDKVARATTRM